MIVARVAAAWHRDPMLQTLYRRVLDLSASPRAPAWLAAVSFAESSFFPVPPDALLIPMCIARPGRAWRLAALCTAMSVLGGMLGYLIGAALYAQVALPLLRFYGQAHALDGFVALYRRWGLWLILVKGMTPIPYKIVTIASGAARFSFPAFLAASVVTRGARFFLLAALMRRFGAPARAFVERRLTLVTSLAACGVAAGFLALRLL
jgi:membrane protein YqaA with SNARE-associated domain